MLTLSDDEVREIVDGTLDCLGVHGQQRQQYVREYRASNAALRALGPIADRYLTLGEPPRYCQVEHEHWEGNMICGNQLPCARHGNR